MSTRSRFFDSVAGDRQYGSDAIAQVLHAISTRDTVLWGYASELKVVPNSPAAMSVRVSTGAAMVQGRFFEVYTSPEVVAVGAAHATLSRIDTIVIRIDYTARTIELANVAGTAAASPTPAALTQSGSVWEFALAYIHVAPTITSIAAIRIADARDLPLPYWGELRGTRQPIAFFEGTMNIGTNESVDGFTASHNPSNGGAISNTALTDAERSGGAMYVAAITNIGNNGGLLTDLNVITADRSPRLRARAKWMTNATAGYSALGFFDDAMTTTDASAIVTGVTRDVVAIVRTDAGNLFFRTVNAGGAATSTDMGADGLSWECYMDGMLKARHTTNLPTVTNLLQAGHIVETAAAAQYNGAAMDYLYVDQDRS
jgi:hypothetical protein